MTPTEPAAVRAAEIPDDYPPTDEAGALNAAYDEWEASELNVDPGDPDAAVFDDDDAESLLGRRARLVDEIERVDALVASRTDRLQRWRAERCNRREAEVERLDDLLIGYLIHLRVDDPNRKSISLPSGTIASSAGTKGRVTIEDAEALDEYLADMPIDDRTTATTKPKVTTAGLRKVCTLGAPDDEGTAHLYYGGEKVPGVWVEGLGRTYRVKGTP